MEGVKRTNSSGHLHEMDTWAGPLILGPRWPKTNEVSRPRASDGGDCRPPAVGENDRSVSMCPAASIAPASRSRKRCDATYALRLIWCHVMRRFGE